MLPENPVFEIMQGILHAQDVALKVGRHQLAIEILRRIDAGRTLEDIQKFLTVEVLKPGVFDV